ncbi:hypothetical protein [Streptomyces sp. LNU-CPARS28]|uniref:hypothetical protein n=1 Tax=Streptomyces sp. LNU-CPARS28 TaxID=3137371 RepID=UPI00313589B7
MTNFAAAADALERAAIAMENNPGLDPDGAVRIAVWGHPDTPYPDDGQGPGVEAFDLAECAIESKVAAKYGYDAGDGIDHLDRSDAIAAARAEAARFRSYG